MDSFINIISLIITMAGFVGILGFSYTALAKKIVSLETFMRNELATRPKDAEVRQLIEDKLAPASVAYDALKARIDELKNDQKDMGTKIDQLLELCSRMMISGQKRR